MEFTALRILLWYDNDEDLYACWIRLKSQRYIAPHKHGFAERRTGTHVLKNLVYRFSETGFRACFRMNGTRILLET